MGTNNNNPTKIAIKVNTLLRADVGFLFQGSALYDSMTVRENLEFPLRRHLDRVETDDIDQLVLDTLDSY